jgi:hypothetical protein
MAETLDKGHDVHRVDALMPPEIVLVCEVAGAA